MAVTHGFIINEAATSVTAPLTATAGLQVVVGTAPVNMLDDPAAAVNTPMIVRSYKEAVEAAGYSDDFEDYTICEAVNASFQVMNVGPLVLINVLDPAKHTTAVEETAVQVNDGVAEVDVTGLHTDRSPTSLAVVSVSPGGERSFRFMRGADTNLSPDEIDEGWVDRSKVLHFGSVSLTAGISLVAAKGSIVEADCDSFTFFVGDDDGIAGGFTREGGSFRLLDEPGLGIDLDF